MPAGATPSRWSTPLSASPCAAVGPPQVLFPSDAPDQPTGPGALVWAAARGCPGGAGARVAEIAVEAAPAASERPRSASGALVGPLGPLSAASSPHGQIAISGSDPRHAGRELLVQGRAGASFNVLLAGAARLGPGALASAYLGDLALLAPANRPGAGALGLRIERWFADAAGPERAAGGPAPGAVSALTVAMDYRSDAIVVWAQSGAVWVRELPAAGAPRQVQRLGPAGSSPHIAALLSDDDRAIVMWSEQRPGTSSMWMDYSATGPRFGAPQLLERVAGTVGEAAAAGSPQLIRLSSESVMCAWAGAEGGRRVVRAAPIDQHGLRTPSTIAAPEGDALLEALAPGPRGDATLLFGEPQRSGPAGASELRSLALFAAAGREAAGRTVFNAPEAVAPAAPLRGVSVAVEPGSDRTVAAWQGAGGEVFYSLRAGESNG